MLEQSCILPLLSTLIESSSYCAQRQDPPCVVAGVLMALGGASGVASVGLYYFMIYVGLFSAFDFPRIEFLFC